MTPDPAGFVGTGTFAGAIAGGAAAGAVSSVGTSVAGLAAGADVNFGQALLNGTIRGAISGGVSHIGGFAGATPGNFGELFSTQGLNFLAVKTAQGGIEGFSIGLINGGSSAALKGALGGFESGAKNAGFSVAGKFGGNLFGLSSMGNGGSGNGAPSSWAGQTGAAALGAVFSTSGVEDIVVRTVNSIDFRGLGPIGQLAVKLNLPIKGAMGAWDLITGYGEAKFSSFLNTAEHRISLSRENSAARSYESEFSGAMF